MINDSIVETKFLKLPIPDGGFSLELGGSLPEVEIAYETYGELSPNKDNVILITHALTGDCHAAGKNHPDDKKSGWWDNMVGPGKGIDTNRFHVICSNILGGCEGTTGPSSINPTTGKPYGLTFPDITIGDMVNVQHALLGELGIDHVFGVIGGSAGGIQVLEWCVRYPEFIDRAICIAAAESLSAQALSFDIISRKIIMNDPKWHGGDYYDKDSDHHGLSLARMIAHITYLSPESMASKFGRDRRDDMQADKFTTDFQVESYLNYQGESFVNRFDANSYLYITQAMNRFSLRERSGSLEETFKPCNSKLFFISLSSDWLYPSSQSRELASALLRAGKRVSYFELQSDYGHDAFLIENKELTDVIASFFEGDSTAAAQSHESYVQSRKDLTYMESVIGQGSTVLDLGCGEGDLLQELFVKKSATGHGIDIDVQSLCGCNRKDIPIFQADISKGLAMIPDNSYDYAIMGRTLLEIQRPEFVINELLRVSREVLISFPNFANWRHRIRLGLAGRLPVSKHLPYEWYNTPNISYLTLKDFESYLESHNVRVINLHAISDHPFSDLLLKAGLKNIGADSLVAHISKS